MKFKFIMAAALVMAAACNNLQTVEEEKEIDESNGRVTVTVNVSGGASTRSTTITEDHEEKVSDIQLFAFNSDGSIDSYAKGTSSTLTINVTTGLKDFVALVNCPELTDISTKEGLMGTVSRLEKNSADHFEMVGEASGKEISAKTNLNITVKRLVSKVIIKKISADFASPYLASLEFKVTGIFLSNVVTTNDYSVGKASGFDWVNKSELDIDNPAKALTQDVFSYSITDSGAHTTAHTFYCYPNPTATDSDEATWSERYTRLVVRTTLGDTVGYYSIPIPNIGSNKKYIINELKITKRGSTHPYEDLATADANFTIEVSDWEPGSEVDIVKL